MSKEKNRNLKYLSLYKQIGDNIRKYRNEKQLSQEALAFDVGSTRNYIGCIERAEKFPSLGFIFDIAKVLNIDVKELFS